MVGPGTGVAPFRAFVQERAAQARAGTPVGKTILFFGCRRKAEDFLYEEEWKVSITTSTRTIDFANISDQQYKADLGDKFEMYTAFSRDGPKKVYVQHLIKEHAAQISSLLERETGGYFYVCGDAANMAREVNVLLGQIIAQERNIPEAKAEQEVKSMRSSNKYQEDVWS